MRYSGYPDRRNPKCVPVAYCFHKCSQCKKQSKWSFAESCHPTPKIAQTLNVESTFTDDSWNWQLCSSGSVWLTCVRGVCRSLWVSDDNYRAKALSTAAPTTVVQGHISTCDMDKWSVCNSIWGLNQNRTSRFNVECVMLSVPHRTWRIIYNPINKCGRITLIHASEVWDRSD